MENSYGRIEYCTSKILAMANKALEVDAFEEQQLINELADAFETLQKRLLSLVFNEADPRRIEICIQHLQRQLLYLADKLDQAFQNLNPANAKSRQHKTLIEVVCQKIEQALTILEENFSRYINLLELVSPGYRIKFRQELEASIPELHLLLKELHLKKAYVDMLCTAASTTSHENLGHHLTYYAAAYLRRMYRELLILVKDITPKEATERINEYLVSINFNAPLFTKFLTGQANEIASKANSTSEKLEILYRWQKKVAQYFQTTATPYIPTMPCARDSLLNWVQHEISCLGNCQQDKSYVTEAQLVADQNIKFNSNLSVKELAALFRLLYDRGIIHHTKTTQMFQVLAPLFKTREAENVSAGSLYNNFYSVKLPAAKAIKSLLLEMSNDVRKFT